METINFREYLIESDWKEYESALDQLIEGLEDGNLNEAFLGSLSTKLKDGIDFIKKVAELIGMSLMDALKAFKNKVIFTFFSKIKWSVSALVGIVKQGYKLWQKLHDVIAKYIAETGVVQWTNDKLTKLDEFLNKHPLVKKAGTLVVVGFLIYQWTQMISFTGDIDFDFDQTTLFEAIKGNYSLADLFATESGVKMLMFIATGVLTGASFPWPGEAWVLFALSLIYTVSKSKYPQVANHIIQNVKKYKGVKL